MRVLHVIPAVAPRYGGPSTSIWPMTRALREHCGFDVEIATTDADGPTRRLMTSDLPKDSGNVHLFPRANGETLKHSPQLRRWLKSNASQYDVIQVHSNWNDPVDAACRAARKAGVAYVLRPCGMLSGYTWSRSKWKKRAYWWWRERSNVRHAAGFHVTSDDERQEVLRLGVNCPIDVIPPGIDEAALTTPSEPNWLRGQCPKAKDRPIVLFLSRLHPKKGITDFLLPAIVQAKSDLFLALVGGEDEHAPGFSQQIEAEIRRLGLSERVQLLGPVPPSRRWAAFDGADLFVLPSHSENFGIVVTEAMARMKPVVVTNGVQIAGHVTASKAGSVIAPNSDELATCIDCWITDSSRRHIAGELGRRYVGAQFTWPRAAERLADLYLRLRRRSPS